MNVLSNLNKINQIKKNIHTAIGNKGVDIPANTPFEDYPNKVSAISGGGFSSDYHFNPTVDVEPGVAILYLNCDTLPSTSVNNGLYTDDKIILSKTNVTGALLLGDVNIPKHDLYSYDQGIWTKL